MSDHDRGRPVPGASLDRPRDRSPEPRLTRNRSFLYRRDASGARSLPSSIRLAASSLGGELVRMRSFFFENDPPAGGAAFPHPHSSAGAHVLTAPDAADADTRLEILKAPEINFTIFALYVATLFAILYVVVVTYIARASWAESQDLTKGAVLETFSTFLRFGINLGFLVLPLFFALRLGVATRVASEQLWIAALLFTGLFCENPLTDLLSSLATVRRGPVASSTASSPSASLGSVAKGSGHAARLVFYDATYTVVIYLYMLLSAHSYRILDAKEYTRSFYLPKLLACAAYFCVKLFLGYTFRIALGVVPFARPLALFYLNSSGRSSIRLLLPALVTTACDTCFAVWVAREVSHTARFLARVPYLENRGKQLGFRCFVFQSVQLITNMLIVSLLLEASLPREALYRSYDWAIGHRKRFIQIEPPVGQLALALVYFTWNVIIAYVNLPPGPIVPYTASGLRSLARVLPAAPLLDRRLWPVWMPFAIATEPDDDDSETEEEDERHLLRGVAGAANVSTLEGLSAQFEETTALEPAQVGVIANAVSWRAGTPKGESCPLRYRHREWHEQIPMPCASFDMSVGDGRSGVADNVYSGELGGADDSLLDYTNIRGDWSEGRVEARGVDANGSAFATPLVDSQSEPVAMPIPERPRSLPGFSPGADDFDSGAFIETTDADENGAQAEFLLSLSPPPLTPCTGQGRLITRKNMFVMETQVTLANAMYLCYIPGNRNEELPLELRKRKGPSGKEAEVPGDLSSFAVGLDELEAETRESESRRQGGDPGTTPSRSASYQYPGRDWELEHDLGTGSSTFPEEIRPVSSVPNVAEADRQPEVDDGTMFLVDPFEMAAKNGYLLYRHIRHDASNGHAIVLVGKDRVIVAFSGTRDRKNWATNSRFMRAPWDDMFRHFDSEPSDTSPEEATDPTARLETPKDVKPSAANLGSRSPEVRLPMNMEDDRRPSEFRSGPRSHALDARFPGSRSGMHSARRHSMSAHGLESVETKAVSPDRNRDNQRRREDATLARPALERGAEGSPLLRRSKSFESVRVYSEDSPSAGQSSRADPRSYGSVRIRESESSARTRSRQNDEEKAGSPWLPSLSRRHPRPGASEFEEVAVSLAQELATYGHCKVHLGFAQAYGKLRNRVMGALVELYGGKLGTVPNSAGPMDSFVSRSSPGAGAVFEQDSDGRPVGVERGSCRGLPIFFVGHSLGGVLATFASYEAARYYRRIGLRRRQDVACTTFGSPMPGNSVFKQRYERMVETHWRFEFASDPVPKLPGILNYNPVGVRVLLDQSGWLMVDPSLVEVQWWGGLAGPYLGARLHIRASYIKALQVFCSRHKGGEDPIGDRFWPFPITCQTRNLFPTDL